MLLRKLETDATELMTNDLGPSPVRHFLSPKAGLQASGFKSWDTLRRKMLSGEFPRLIEISDGRKVFDAAEIRAWQDAKIAARDAKAI